MKSIKEGEGVRQSVMVGHKAKGIRVDRGGRRGVKICPKL